MNKTLNIACLLAAAALLSSCGGNKPKENSDYPDWAWADFQRPEGVTRLSPPMLPASSIAPCVRTLCVGKRVTHSIPPPR